MVSKPVQWGAGLLMAAAVIASGCQNGRGYRSNYGAATPNVIGYQSPSGYNQQAASSVMSSGSRNVQYQQMQPYQSTTSNGSSTKYVSPQGGVPVSTSKTYQPATPGGTTVHQVPSPMQPATPQPYPNSVGYYPQR
ncbi:MAG: hypothetical protein KatS3mg105_1707 [Gemmatales bacterium]|nr:MAG: hypothetical protein KatS3mg105_1707 [Gemmatales bacterium]